MKSHVSAITMICLVTLVACGGGTAPEVEGHQDQQPTITNSGDQPPDNPLAAPSPADPIETLAPEGATTIPLQREALGSVELPAIPPELLVANDTEMPQLLLFYIADGSVVHGTVNISTTALDDTGVNYIALLIDDVLVVSYESETLEYTWDTREEADGEHLVEFVVRDNGGNTGVCSLQVHVNNTTDWGPPQISLESITCTYGEYQFQPNQISYTSNNSFYVCGEVDVAIEAWDATGLKQLSVYKWIGDENDVPSRNEDGSSNLAFFELVARSLYGDVLLELSADSLPEHQSFLVIADDNAGETSEFRFTLIPQTTARVYALFHDAEGNHIECVTLYLMPQDWEPAVVINLSDAVEVSISDNRYVCSFANVVLGLQHFVAVYGSYVEVIPFEALPINRWNQMPKDDFIYVIAD